MVRGRRSRWKARSRSAQAVIQNGAPALPESHQRALNWSAVRDEVQDFTRNVRAVSGGGGLILGIPEGAAGLGQVPDLTPVANTGRSADLDAIATYLALGVRAPISPVSSQAQQFGHLKQGRELFEAAGCQNCHGGANWTISALDFTPPPAAGQIVDAQLIKFLCRVGTFDPALFTDGVSNEIRANNVANVQARGNPRLQRAVADLGLRQRALPAQRGGADAGRGARERDAPERRPAGRSGHPDQRAGPAEAC